MVKEQTDKVRKIIEPVLNDCHVELFSIDWHKDGHDNVLSILIDRDEGIDLDICVEVSEKISALLDVEDPIKEEYLLEVASAGAEKPLKDTQQFQKAISKYILVVVKEQVEGYDELVGYLRDVNEESITLEIKIKTRIKNVVIKRANIAQAMTSVKI